jgi:hypothetical protein
MSHGIKQRDTFKQVLNNGDDQVIVRQLLLQLIPEKLQQEIIVQFNNHATKYNRRTVKLYGKDELREGCHV